MSMHSRYAVGSNASRCALAHKNGVNPARLRRSTSPPPVVSMAMSRFLGTVDRLRNEPTNSGLRTVCDALQLRMGERVQAGPTAIFLDTLHAQVAKRLRCALKGGVEFDDNGLQATVALAHLSPTGRSALEHDWSLPSETPRQSCEP